jgi:hypothetical protein
MGTAGALLLAAVLAVALLVLQARWRVAVRAEFIRGYTLPTGLFDKLRTRHPHLSAKDCQLVSHALRQFFLAYLKSGRQFVSMPSQVADDLWHEFILYTKNYDNFCRKAFGRFLHHSPAAVLGSGQSSNVGLRRAWWYCCREENINPRSATRLPLLFAIDAKLQIANGFFYVADCSRLVKGAAQSDSGPVIHCGGDFSSPGIDGSSEGFGDFGSGGHAHAGSGSEGGHDGGGHGGGGDGCGGGGCGGGGD